MIVDDNGAAVRTSATWQDPRGGPCFGWLSDTLGFCTIRIDDVQAIFPDADPRVRGLYKIIMRDGIAMSINDQDVLRLMKRLGWTEPGQKRSDNRAN